MLHTWKRTLAASLGEEIRRKFGVEHLPVVEVPPRRSLGDLALPAPLHLARSLQRKPREIAEELAAGWALPPGARELRVEGAGYLNVFLDRPAFAARLLEGELFPAPEGAPGKTIVEHTNINPNKAAHIGHLRNAVLGDLLVRSLRVIGREVEVQNYIDDTGVQVADVVVGFCDIERKTVAEVAAIPEPFDYYCWDLYARVGRWYEEDPARQTLRRETLHALEAGRGRARRHGPAGGPPDRGPPSRDHGAARRPLRPADPRERTSSASTSSTSPSSSSRRAARSRSRARARTPAAG